MVVCDGSKACRGGERRVGEGHRANLISPHFVLAGWSHRSPRRQERTYADACLRGPHADLSLLAEAGRVVASWSRAQSAVMRFQPEPGSAQHRAELIAVQAGGLRFVIQARAADMNRWEAIEEFFFPAYW